MIKSVTCTNYLGESIRMVLKNPDLSGFNIHQIDGLGPGKAEINTSPITTGDGTRFNSARNDERNITMLLEFLFAPDIETVRQKSYKYFPIQTPVHLLIETDNRTVEIEGNVEANEPVIFNKREYTQISFICEYPWFYLAGDRGIQNTTFYGVDAAFEYPFSNESLTIPLLEFGIINIFTESNVYYIGDKEIGMMMQVEAVGPASNISVHDITKNEAIFIDSTKLIAITGSDIVAGDKFYISTIKGSKGVQLLRNGVYINVLNAVNRNADWFTLRKGDNNIAFDADSGLENLRFRIQNRVIFEGV